jgi:glycine/D-amino acid oxidase-like deaminating enzyme
MRVVSGKSNSTVWGGTTAAAAAWPSLVGAEDAEVAIVGAGISGLSLALHLADLGLRPVVIEAHEEAAGAAGRSAGVVAPQLVRHTPTSVAKLFGEARATRLLKLVADGGKHVFSIIGDRRAECGATQSGFLAPARGDAGTQRVAAITEGWATIRKDLKVVDGAEVARMSGCTGYGAAVFDPSGGSANPLAYARYLARQAAAAGASIYTQSRVEKIERRGDRWHLSCAGGSLQARLVVACANGGNGQLHPSLSRTAVPLPVCQVATEPLATAELRGILAGGQSLTDMETDVFSIRLDPDGRLVTAYPAGNRGHDSSRLAGRVNDRLCSTLPDYRRKPLAFAWTGHAFLHPSFMPRVYRVDADFYAVQACNGRGIALNTVIGRDMAEWISSKCKDEWALLPETPTPIAGYLVARFAPLIMMKAALIKRMFTGQNNSNGRVEQLQ